MEFVDEDNPLEMRQQAGFVIKYYISEFDEIYKNSPMKMIMDKAEHILSQSMHSNDKSIRECTAQILSTIVDMNDSSSVFDFIPNMSSVAGVETSC
jgi:hypothetical protein